MPGMCCGKRNNAGTPVTMQMDESGCVAITHNDGETVVPNLGKAESYCGHFLDADDIDEMPVEEIVARLEALGVRVILISDQDEDGVYNDKQDIKDVINQVSASPYDYNDHDHEFDNDDAELNLRYRCCFLYRDAHSRLWNITLTGGEGLQDKWDGQDISYSGLQGIILLVVLTRIFPCAGEGLGVAPALLSLVIGLVFREEIENSHVAVGLHVCGIPSVSAFVFKGFWISDWPKHLALLLLSLTGVASTLPIENLPTYFTIASVSMTCGLLAANLGARAWKHLQFKPLPWARGVWTPLGFLAAYGVAVLLGISVPFLGMRQVYRGGHSALRTINVSAFATALFYILSDFDFVQKFLVNGAERCNQDLANIIMGSWLILSTLASIGLYRRIPKKKIEPEQKKLLADSHLSPVGLIVPLLPNHDIDTKQSVSPSTCSETAILLMAVPMAVLVGALIMAMGFIEDIPGL